MTTPTSTDPLLDDGLDGPVDGLDGGASLRRRLLDRHGADLDQHVTLIDDLTGSNPTAVAASVAESGRAPVVVIDATVELDTAIELVAALDEQAPTTSTVLVAEPTADTLARAMRAGAADVVGADVDDASFDHVLDRARSRAMRAGPPVGEGEQIGSTVLVVVSPKGGAGKTFLATNLALALTRSHPDQTVLVDLDLQFGDVAATLGLHPEYTFTHAVSANPNPTALKGFLTPHPSRLLCLCAPSDPVEAEDTPITGPAEVLAKLRESFRWIVVDTSPGLSEATMTAIEAANDLIVVSSTDVASVNACRKELDIIEQMARPGSSSIHFVLNRSDARVGLDPDDIAAVIGREPVGGIPSSGAIPMSMNHGEPVVLADAGSSPARAIEAIAAAITGETGIAAGNRRFLGRFMR